MTVIRGLAEVVFMVADLERSVAFYRDTLGLELFSPSELPAKFLRVGENINTQEVVIFYE